LGGGKRKVSTFLLAGAPSKELEQVGQWMKEGKVKPVIDSTWSFDKVPQAFEKLKTGRAKGKIVVTVSS
jgi:NADPH:quinone reductase-like Zn-dependent oxidoreductase